ncbi:MAG: CHAD domain-containing protein [Leptolyngbyaceae cyanobacterium MO_188.B28]|nr:CHAD domain-containing protein [Leptolyngbyaceae cyanobacterium MO_188.B28]
MTVNFSQNLGSLARESIRKYYRQATKYEKLVLKDRDPEDLHQMRVGMRRLRTAMRVFSPGIQLPKAASEAKVSAMSCRLGSLRDLDVIEDALKHHYRPLLPKKEQKALDIAIKRLSKKRGRIFKQVKKVLGGKQYNKLKESLNQWLAHPSYRPIAIYPSVQILPDLLLPLVSQLWLHPGWLVGTTLEVNGPQVDSRLTLDKLETCMAEENERLHSLRKQVKRVRYQLRLAADYYSPAILHHIKVLADIQETLGTIQDSVVLADFLTKAAPGFPKQLPTLVNQLADNRYQAWRHWQALQQHYLIPQNRDTLRLEILQPLASLKEPLQQAS